MYPRFFLEGNLTPPLILSGSEFHHLSRVLRIRVGEQIELINGKGSLVRARVERFDKEAAYLTLTDSIILPRSSPLLILGIALFRLNRLEWLIEKGTELGADGFYLFPAERSEQKNLSDHQKTRLHQLMLSAVKQCKRLYLPELRFFDSLSHVFPQESLLLFGDPDPKIPFLYNVVLPPASSIFFLTGPEGGFSSKETILLKEQSALPIRLHEYILRAETAPLAAICSLYMKKSIYSSQPTQ